jgi:ElaB/YqjD/DUF883 family membrane-anchored ribosome-binding protein
MTALAEPSRNEIAPTIADRVVDSVRRVVHASHEARLFKTIAEDALEGRVYAAQRAITTAQRRVRDNLGDLKDEAARCVKRQPLAAVGTAFGAGLLIGAGFALALRSAARVR